MLYNFYRFLFLVTLKNFRNLNEGIVASFLEYNNRRTLKWLKEQEKPKILLLLPHCIQNSGCKIRITNHLDNCVSCGKCKIGALETLDSEQLMLNIKIATGGTLARNYIKETRPDLIIAVACKRDLILGIVDAQPFHVYGILNRITSKDCMDTDFSISQVENVLKRIITKEEK